VHWRKRTLVNAGHLVHVGIPSPHAPNPDAPPARDVIRCLVRRDCRGSKRTNRQSEARPYYRYAGLKGTKGFGQVKPREIYYGGDPTGLVCKIHWHSWGGRVTRGTGVGWYISGNHSVAQGHAAIADVKATKLGTWTGRPAYNRLTWSFPNHGRDRPASSCA
jgi:hypothetical protein